MAFKLLSALKSIHRSSKISLKLCLELGFLILTVFELFFKLLFLYRYSIDLRLELYQYCFSKLDVLVLLIL
jgi:hypothetical protein